MSTKIALINRALSFLGERSITNPDRPETPAGKHIADGFDDSRQEVLRRYPWNFAEVWTTTDLTDAPEMGYDDAYVFPSDCLRLLFVGTIDDSTRDYRILWQPDHNRKVIALNNGGANTLNLAYTADVQLLSAWDPLARKVLAIWMALDAAKSITGKLEMVQVLNQLLSDELKDAVAVDGQEQAIRQHSFSHVQDARDMAQYGNNLFTNVEGYY